MTDTAENLRRKIASAGDLQSVVRTMKMVAATSIGQYEASVRALGDYLQTVELGLGACLRESKPPLAVPALTGRHAGVTVVVVFGSDQGLVGQFNDRVADYAVERIGELSPTPQIWAVGDRVHGRLTDAGLSPAAMLPVPASVAGITPLVGEILVKSEKVQGGAEARELHLFYNRPVSRAAYTSVGERLLPLDDDWRRRLLAGAWPTKGVPQIMGAGTATLSALVREYLFISLFRACAESLASENGSRLAAMERADKNIDTLLTALREKSHRVRQSRIDEELFDVVSGFEALSERGTP